MRPSLQQADELLTAVFHVRSEVVRRHRQITLQQRLLAHETQMPKTKTTNGAVLFVLSEIVLAVSHIINFCYNFVSVIQIIT